jgi:hypothetical protein
MRQNKVVYVFAASDGSHRYAFTLKPDLSNLAMEEDVKWEFKSKILINDVIEGQWPVNRELFRYDLKTKGLHITVLTAMIVPFPHQDC